MQTLWTLVWKVFKAGGWFPVVMFAVHLILNYIVRIYDFWPSADVPMHFLGGLAIAFFVSGSFRLIDHQTADPGRTALLEKLLVFSFTATTAVFWEFAEFILDRLFDTNIQVSLANTMQDLAMGLLGAVVLILLRNRQWNTGFKEIKQLLTEMAG